LRKVQALQAHLGGDEDDDNDNDDDDDEEENGVKQIWQLDF